tara:strand:- start:1799 stop:1987 length:189 start_codon:yes stop_codon:yes gene_type:complete
MINDILHMERDLLATLTTLKQLITEHDVFVMKGMIEPLDNHIKRAKYVINELELSVENNDGK